MEQDSKQPREWDTILGQIPPHPADAVVLGGLQGVKQRLTSDVEDIRIAALKDALNYGVAGLKLVRQFLDDSQIGKAAYSILWEWREKGLRQKLQPITASLLADLEDIIYKPYPLRFHFLDDGCQTENCWTPFIWEFERLGEFSIRKLFELTQRNTEDFLQQSHKGVISSGLEIHYYYPQEWDLEIKQKFQEFIDFLRLHLENFQVCRLSFTAPHTEDYTPGNIDSIRGITNYVRSAVFIGRIADGDWVAIAPNSPEIEFHNYDETKDKVQPLIKKLAEPSKQSLEFLKKLELAIKKIPCSAQYNSQNSTHSANYYPDYIWEVATTREIVLDKLLKSTNIIIVRNFDDFDYQTNERYRKLAKFFRVRLQNPVEYILFDNYIYILGQMNIKDVAGIFSHIF